MLIALEMAWPLALMSLFAMWWRAIAMAVLAPSNSMVISWCGEALMAALSVPTLT